MTPAPSELVQFLCDLGRNLVYPNVGDRLMQSANCIKKLSADLEIAALECQRRNCIGLSEEITSLTERAEAAEKRAAKYKEALERQLQWAHVVSRRCAHCAAATALAEDGT